jgi:hypothetical protein
LANELEQVAGREELAHRRAGPTSASGRSSQDSATFTGAGTQFRAAQATSPPRGPSRSSLRLRAWRSFPAL